MPTTDSDACRPPIPGHVDHVFRQHADRFFGAIRNRWTTSPEQVDGLNGIRTGGRQRAGETLEQCAVRELMEETSIRLVRSLPVSLFYTREDPHDAARMIMSVAVLAEEWSGEPRTQEPESHAGWKWHKLSELPDRPLEPTATAVEQYEEEIYPCLHWDDVEEKPRGQLSLLEGPLAEEAGTEEGESYQ